MMNFPRRDMPAESYQRRHHSEIIGNVILSEVVVREADDNAAEEFLFVTLQSVRWRYLTAIVVFIFA